MTAARRFLWAAAPVFTAGAAWAHGMSEADRQAMLEGGYGLYLWLGAKHMLTGYDHLLFLLGVIFFLTGFRDVVRCVTAFTLGHSLTLILATLFQITASYYLVDAVIALSVCYKGFDNLDGFRRYLGREPPDMVRVIFAFGLVHGFGLSTRLQTLPLGADLAGLVGRILSFNVGVEVGQVLALVVMVAALAGWRRTEAFRRFGRVANGGLVAAGLLLFLFQMHGWTHERFGEELGFNYDAHYHAHEAMDLERAREAIRDNLLEGLE
ncbi:HupE/UreJ family protein [Deferrisoma sp.]